MSSDESDGPYGPKILYPDPESAMKPYVYEPYPDNLSNEGGGDNDTHKDTNDTNNTNYDNSNDDDDDEGEDNDDNVHNFAFLDKNGGDNAGQDKEEDQDQDPLVHIDLQEMVNQMSKIDLSMIDKLDTDEHQNVIRALGGDAITDFEKHSLEMTKERLDAILKPLPANVEAERIFREDPMVREAVERYRGWVASTVNSIVTLMLVARKRTSLPQEMIGWMLYILANAEKKSRGHLIQALTHFSVVPISIQYALGQLSWRSDLFDQLPKINLKNPETVGDAVSAYLAVAHKLGLTYSYAGSATCTNSIFKQVGESRRMSQHANILKLGYQEIHRRRRQPEGNSDILNVHEHMAEAGDDNYFFVAMTRIPVDIRDQEHVHASALVLLAEVVNMILVGTNTTDAIPRQRRTMGRVAEFMNHTAILMDGLRPKDCPTPPWKGANKVLPLLQMPKGVWALLRQGSNLNSPIAYVFNDLRNHLKDTHELSLSAPMCRQILEKHGRPSANPDIRVLRRFYAMVLHENNLSYKNNYQVFLYVRAVLWHAIIQVAENGIATIRNGKYYIEVDALDWARVSEIAKSKVPEPLEHMFTRDGCFQLYHDKESRRFNQQVLFPAVWEKLREDVPARFAYSKAKLQFTPAVRMRILHVCNYILIQKLKEASSAQVAGSFTIDVKLLNAAVINQLQSDIQLSSMKPRDGAWEDTALIMYVNRSLKLALKEVNQYPDRVLDNKLTKLDTLEPNWDLIDKNDKARPLLSSGTQAKEWLDPQLKVSQLATTSREFVLEPVRGTDPEILQRVSELQAKHVESARIMNAETRIGSRDQNESKGNVEDPFDLCDDNGVPFGQKVFVAKKAKVKEVQTSKTSSICPHCLLSWGDLPSHLPQCLGRCDTCIQEQVPCIKNPENPLHCIHCKAKGMECVFSSSMQDIEPTVDKAICPRCLCQWTLAEMEDHAAACHGRCSSCVQAGQPCIRLPNGTECQRCENSSQNCEAFSHGYLFPDKEPKAEPEQDTNTCNRCLCPKTHRTHTMDCPGRCAACVDAEQPCHRSHLYPAKCDHCESQGLDCGDYSHIKAKRVRNNKFCQYCLRTDVYVNHIAKCKGRCKGCRAAGRPCVREKGDGRKCRDCKTAEECGDYDNEANVPKDTCKSCGNEYPTQNLRVHEKTCPGRCTRCTNLAEGGVPCKRPARSSTRPCKQCEEDGCGEECDAPWVT